MRTRVRFPKFLVHLDPWSLTWYTTEQTRLHIHLRVRSGISCVAEISDFPYTTNARPNGTPKMVSSLRSCVWTGATNRISSKRRTLSFMGMMNDGREIPSLGYGTWLVSDEGAESLVADAIAAGYRHVDTASMYGNETGVGKGIRASGIDRTQVFVTTKLWNSDQSDPEAALTSSLDRLGLDYVDLYLIHWPVPRQHLYVRAWETLIKLRERGLAASIGVSNFSPEHLDALQPSGVVPAVNQSEVHPSFANRQIAETNAERGIVTECYSPLGRAGDLAEPVLTRIAARLGATPAQVVLAWHLAKGFVAIPKSASPARIRENFQAQNLDLTVDDIAAIDSLDRGNRIGSDPTSM